VYIYIRLWYNGTIFSEETHMINSSQATLARLLAKENLEIQHGNFRTAFFDVEKRILGLPLWKDRGRDVYDLLTGHEVGHALYTPADGWHDSVEEIPGCPRSYVNVVEDVRIEKLVQRTYPGLVSSFKRGYIVLNKEDFFQIAGRDVSEMSVVDRINLKAKLRDLIEIKFSAEETPIVNQVMAVETWEDVIAACKALYEFMKDQQKPQPPEEEEEWPENAPTSVNKGDDSDDDEEDDSESPSAPDETPTDDDSGKDEEKEPVAAKPAPDDIEKVETDEAFRANEHKLLDVDKYGDQPTFANGLSKEQADRCIIPYKQLKELRMIRAIERGTQHDTISDAGLEAVNSFESENKPVVATMAKEFEMRKAAYRLQRSQTSRSGSINVNMLHSYKYNDDIFRKVTNLADAKSHGMVMFVDYSGSMSMVMGKVMRQAITLADFCAKVNIPFVVYGFTSKRAEYRMNDDGTYNKHYQEDKEYPGHVSEKNCAVFELLSSKLNRSDLKEARELLLRQSIQLDRSHSSDLQAHVEYYGSTPLHETILCSEYIVKEFKATTGVQKINMVFLTDGDGDGLHVYRPLNSSVMGEDNTVKSARAFAIKMNGTIVKASSRWDLGPALLNELKKIQGVTVIGFYVCNDAKDFKQQQWRVSTGLTSPETMAASRKLYNSQKFVSHDNVRGYDKYFILKGQSLNTDNDSFEIEPQYTAITKAQITKAFKKHTSSKKGNRVLATQFAKLVA